MRKTLFQLLDYDIFHFEWGLEFYRDGRFVEKLYNLNKPIICTYHGTDLRSRGVIPKIDKMSTLNLTSLVGDIKLLGFGTSFQLYLVLKGHI